MKNTFINSFSEASKNKFSQAVEDASEAMVDSLHAAAVESVGQYVACEMKTRRACSDYRSARGEGERLAAEQTAAEVSRANAHDREVLRLRLKSAYERAHAVFWATIAQAAKDLG
jgi:hypothetical protein